MLSLRTRQQIQITHQIVGLHGWHLTKVRTNHAPQDRDNGAACDTAGINASNPFDFEYVRSRIEYALREFEGQFTVIQVPNITHVFYGRDVGYVVAHIDLDASLKAISATEVRRQLAASAE